MGLTAWIPQLEAGGRERQRASSSAADRRLDSHTPRELLAGRAAARPLALAQAYLCAGAAVIGTLAALLPHPDQFNVEGLLAVQAAAALTAVALFLFAGRVPFILIRIAPGLGAPLTTLAVFFSGSSTSGFVMLYLWIGLYAFYFPATRRDAIVHVAWAVACYAVAVAVTPSAALFPHANVHYFVYMAGTLITAGILLTYLRGRLERLMTRLMDASHTDPLTGLLNRVALQKATEREIERVRHDGRVVSLLVLDIDSFKRFNERHGIGAGDEMLQEVARLVEAESRLIDLVARSGGEEFTIVLPETDQHRAFMFAEELLGSIRQQFTPPRAQITASIGIACFPDHAEDAGGLIAAADDALQAAKTLGRDRAVIYSPEVTSTLGESAGRRNIESQAQLSTVLSLAEALDQRDSRTARHSQTVGRLCDLMARELGMSEEHVQRVRLAGILHDIGKIGVPDLILQKHGPLTPSEQAQMRRHPELGARILSSSELDDLRAWILAHHERPDGTGYPKGLGRDEIPIEAAVVAVADAYEAMTSDRVYRLAIDPEDARDELRLCAGTQFDRRVVDALVRALDREAVGVS